MNQVQRWRHVFTDVDEVGAQRCAQEADRQLADGDRRPLLGVPVAVEDSLPSTASTALRTAGAVVVGRTSAAERHRNPVQRVAATALDPRVSGTAVAVAAGVVGAALAGAAPGAGEVPAAVAGTVGYQTGCRTGVLARQVADIALVLEGLGLEMPRNDRPLRIGVSMRGLALHTRTRPQMRRVVEDVAALLSMHGNEVLDYDPQLAERGSVLLAPHLMASPPELALLGRLVPSPLRGLCRRLVAAERAMLDDMFDGIDLLVTPGHTGPAEAMSLPARGAVLVRTGVTTPFSPLWRVSRYPAVSVLGGWSEHGHPLPVLLVAAPPAEGALLDVARLIEEERCRTDGTAVA